MRQIVRVRVISRGYACRVDPLDLGTLAGARARTRNVKHSERAVGRMQQAVIDTVVILGSPRC
jgi:hypothetical protein